jgi:hypothetical protein
MTLLTGTLFISGMMFASAYYTPYYNVYQNAPTSNSYVYTQSQNIKFNNVVTSPVTEITKNSARCNGIGLIASGAHQGHHQSIRTRARRCPIERQNHHDQLL